MNWPELQLEHLVAAATVSWLALAWFCWGSGQRLTAHGSLRDPAWNWLAGAALLGALEFLAWLVVTQLRLDSWPEWARTLVAIFTAAQGVTAALTAWVWTGRTLSRAAGWCALFGAALLTSASAAIVPVLAGLGWLSLALVFLFRDSSGLARPNRLAFGGALIVLAVAEAVAPDLTHLVLRLPSELPVQWGSRELVTLSLISASVLAAGSCLWVADRPRRAVWGAGALAAGLALWLYSWVVAHHHAQERAATWDRLETAATALAPAVAPRRLEPDEVRLPAYAGLVAQLMEFEHSFSQPAYLWLWTERNGMVVHVADTANLGNRATAPRTPPGYRYPQLHNFVLRAQRGERFESGPYFVAGDRRVGLHVPLRLESGPPVAWLQLSMPFSKWLETISDPRVPALIVLLCVGGLTGLVLAGQTWLHTTRKLHGQAVEADASARAKNEMAGLVSHELRTPLQVVLGHLELLAATPQPPETQRTLKVIEGQCRQLLGLVNDTLDLCALEAGQLPLRPVRFSPKVLAEVTVRNLQPLASKRGLACELVLQPGLPDLVEADAARIQQILTNLLANAVKYTAQGSVRLNVSRELPPASRLVFTVTDTGPGLPTTVLARLGEAFQTGPSRQGTGLGLAMVRRLCAHLGGEFSVANAASGGCVATVRLPAAIAAPDDSLFGSRAPMAQPAPALDGLRLVLAEDNTLVREMITAHFRSLGAQVEAVADGAAAVYLCRVAPPDAVLLDLAMPGMDGRTAARALRQSGAAAPRLIVGLSAEAISDEEARLAGFDRFFVKPVALADLAAVFSPMARDAQPAATPAGRIRQIFQREAPGQLSALRAAAAQGNRQEVARLAHYLQGSAYALSNETLRAACTELRRRAEAPGGTLEADELLRTLEEEARRVLNAPG
jgi:signal transduction histidine kinase/DNA-binding response OmpR family regulator